MVPKEIFIHKKQPFWADMWHKLEDPGIVPVGSLRTCSTVPADVTDVPCNVCPRTVCQEAYVQKMRRPGTWGSQLELMAICQSFQVRLGRWSGAQGSWVWVC